MGNVVQSKPQGTSKTHRPSLHKVYPVMMATYKGLNENTLQSLLDKQKLFCHVVTNQKKGGGYIKWDRMQSQKQSIH